MLEQITAMNSEPVIHEVFSVRATNTENVLILDVDMTDMTGERSRCEYAVAPDDEFGLNPFLRQWIIDHEGEYTIIPYVPPTPEEIRAGMPPLVRVKFKLALSRSGIKSADVQAAINTVEDPDELDEAQIIWDDEQSFTRLMPFVVSVIGSIRTPEQIDVIWQLGLTL